MRMPFLGPDGSYRMRTLKDTTVKDHLRVWLGWSTFGRTLYREISGRSINTTMRDFVAWIKILVTLMFYKCTVKSLFENKNGMYKHLPMEWGLTKNKFMDMWRALQPTVSACTWTGLFPHTVSLHLSNPFVMGDVIHIGGTQFS
jgi:hypothetical protein